jgi:hypothetical protein
LLLLLLLLLLFEGGIIAIIAAVAWLLVVPLLANDLKRALFARADRPSDFPRAEAPRVVPDEMTWGYPDPARLAETTPGANIPDIV